MKLNSTHACTDCMHYSCKTCAGTVRAEDDTSHRLGMPKLRGAICDRIVRAETEARTHVCSATTVKLKPANMCDGTSCTESENCPHLHFNFTP